MPFAVLPGGVEADTTDLVNRVAPVTAHRINLGEATLCAGDSTAFCVEVRINSLPPVMKGKPPFPAATSIVTGDFIDAQVHSALQTLGELVPQADRGTVAI
ncbi:hypothetical protein D3C80_1744080 [compost metagenome]